MNELNADSYVISIPFILLSSIGAIKKLTYSKMLLLQAFLFSQFTIVQLYNSPNGLAAGIFYWLYPYCHYNIILANEVPQIFLIHSILLVVFIVSLLVVILYFIMYKKNKKSTNSSLGKLQDKKSSFDRSPVTRISLKKNKRTILFVIFITFAILLVNINTYQIPNNNAFRSSNDFPYELFIPTFSNGYSTYVQQSPGLYSYYSANNTLFFWPQSVGIGLSRNITSQNLYLSGTFFIKDPTNQLTPPSVIVRSNNLVGGISGGVFIENNSTKLRPLYMSNIANQTLPSNYYLGLSLLHNSSIKAYSYSNYSYAEYKLSYSLVYKKSVLFGAYITKPAASQNILWRMQIDNITYESFVYDSSFISGYFFNSTWHFYTLATVKLHEWLMVGLTFNKNGSITSFVNGYQSTFPKLINQPVEIELNTGMFGNSTKYTAFSFSGIETAIFLMPSVDQNVYFITYIQDPKTNAVTTGKMNDLSDIKITFRETGNGTTTLVVGTTNVTISENAFYIAFGSISPSRLSIGYHFYSVMIKGRTTVPNYLMLVVEDSVIYPVLVLFLLCTDNRRKR
ncbi:MAG: hypothetical protein M1477_04990 [Candidatus Thermoplasmatota archaeon]|nr:hypothetical protein [Candidatus Thermoplasmatota archaeon]